MTIAKWAFKHPVATAGSLCSLVFLGFLIFSAATYERPALRTDLPKVLIIGEPAFYEMRIDGHEGAHYMIFVASEHCGINEAVAHGIINLDSAHYNGEITIIKRCTSDRAWVTFGVTRDGEVLASSRHLVKIAFPGGRMDIVPPTAAPSP